MKHTIETIRLGTSGYMIEREYRGANNHKLTIIIETPTDRTLFGDMVEGAPEATLKEILFNMGDDAPYIDNMERRLDRGLGRASGFAQEVRDYFEQGGA